MDAGQSETGGGLGVIPSLSRDISIPYELTEEKVDTNTDTLNKEIEKAEEKVFIPMSKLRPEIAKNFADTGPTNTFKVRGKTYMTDNVKVAAGPSVGILLHTDLVEVVQDPRYYNATKGSALGGLHIASEGNARIDHIAKHHPRISEVLKDCGNYRFPGSNEKPFLLILNLQVPGAPPLSTVLVFALPYSIVRPTLSNPSRPPYALALERFCRFPESKTNDAGEYPLSDYTNKRFKLIPSIVDGPWLVKTAVGNKPALLGQKLIQRYFYSESNPQRPEEDKGPEYLEVDVDVGSSIIAAKIVGLCRGYAKSIQVDIGFCVQGESEEELPEKIFGGVRIINIDLEKSHLR